MERLSWLVFSLLWLLFSGRKQDVKSQVCVYAQLRASAGGAHGSLLCSCTPQDANAVPHRCPPDSVMQSTWLAVQLPLFGLKFAKAWHTRFVAIRGSHPKVRCDRAPARWHGTQGGRAGSTETPDLLQSCGFGASRTVARPDVRASYPVLTIRDPHTRRPVTRPG